MSHDITPLSSTEAAHRLKALEHRSDEHSDAINGVVREMAVRAEVLKSIAGELAEIKGLIKWGTRIILTAFLGGIVALVLRDPPTLLPSHSPTGTAPSSSPVVSP